MTTDPIHNEFDLPVQARRDRDRAAELLAKQLVARQVLDDADTRLQLAEAARRSATFAADNARIVAPTDGVSSPRSTTAEE